MPRFYFNIRDGGDIEDAEGIDLPDFKAARLEGIRLSGAIIAAEADHLTASEDWKLEVTDQTGLTLFVMIFSIMHSPALQQST